MCPATISTSRSTHALEAGVAKLWVLLVGVNHYNDQNLPSLQYSAPDCQGLGKALLDATHPFPQKDIRIFHDFAEQTATLATVRKSLQEIATSARSEDTVLFYFSGHGVLDANTQQAVLCLTDTQRHQLLETGLALQELLQCLGQCAARQQLVWLDACHSGGMTLRGARGQGETEPLLNPTPQLVEVLRQRAAQSKGFYALLSCDQDQRSWEFPELGHGVFTYYLMRGLRGEAADGVGIVEADGLYKYIYHQTLQYIDKTNQQIRLVNQQKSSRGDTLLLAEYPLQTPKRIVEGVGELILGAPLARRSRPESATTTVQQTRRALVIEGVSSQQTTLGLSKILHGIGKFEVEYLPRPGKDWSTIKESIQACLGNQNQNPSDRVQEPTTVLLYLRGRIEETEDGEAWLMVGDGMRLSRSWLRQALRQSNVKQQIVILDCPGSRSLTAWVDDLQLNTEGGQCLIAAAAIATNPNQFAQALVDTLNDADPQVGLSVAAWIARLQVYLADTGITPQVWLSGIQGVIEILPGRAGSRSAATSETFDLGLCPYMGLKAFTEEDTQYFYGRDVLTQQLIDAFNRQAALAVVGASGSGKSSVVQAGLIAQLRQGRQIPGSDRWWIGYMRPGDRPLDALARRLVDPGSEKERSYQQLQIEGLLYQGVDGFVRWLRSRSEPMVVLVVDQAEELFTLASAPDRQQFLDIILGALNYASDRFKLVLALRADFITAGMEVPELAQILQQSSLLVPPYLTEDDYRQAIAKPAEQVGLTVEPGLEELLLQELNHTASDLPLLEFVLEQLWERRQAGQLTLQSYQQIGGLKGALERQAQTIYDSLDPDAQACARWIFLSLTQLGDGTEDTRRRIPKSALAVAKYPPSLVERTLQSLTAAKLVIVDLEDAPATNFVGQSKGSDRQENAPTQTEEHSAPQEDLQQSSVPPTVTVEVAHEILIRHWSTLRWWLEENRAHLRLQRQLEQAAMLWLQRQQQPDFLLRGVRLAEAEDLYIKYTDELSDSVQRFIEAGLEQRRREQQQERQRLRRAQMTAALIGVLGLAALALGGAAFRQQVSAQAEKIEALNASSDALLWSNQQLESLLASMKAGRQLNQLDPIGRWLLGRTAWTELETRTTSTLQQALLDTQEVNRLEGHTQSVRAISFSPDGQLLASAGDDNTVILWRRDGTLLTTLKETNAATADARVTSVTFSPDGQTLAVASTDRTITLWQINRTATVEATLLTRLNGHTDWVTNLSFSPDGQTLASASRDRTIKLWRLNGSLIKTLTGHQGWVNAIRFSSDGTIIASASEDKTIRLWRKDGVLIRILNGHGDRVTSVAFSPAQQQLASGSGDNTVRLWNLATGTSQLFTRSDRGIHSHRDQVDSVSFSPDGQTLASASADGTINLWSKDGTLRQTLEGHGGEVFGVAFSPDGNTLASASADETVRLWNTHAPLLQPTDDSGIYAVSFSPAPSRQKQAFVTGGWDGTLKLWQDDRNGTPQSLATVKAHTADIRSIQFSPDGQRLASAGGDRLVKLWQVNHTELVPLQTLTGHQDGVTSIAFSSDGEHLASGSNDRTIQLWTLHQAQGKQIASPQQTLTGHSDGITDVAFSPNGKLLASASYDQTVKLWRLDDSGATDVQTLQHEAAIAAVSFSPNGNQFATASWDNTVHLWQISNHPNQPASLIRTFTRHPEGAISLSFSPDGQRLAVGSANGTIKLWSTATGTLIKTLLGHRAPVFSLSFSADGQTLISADENFGFLIWNLHLDSLLEQGCDRIQNYLHTNSLLKQDDRQICP